MLLKAEMGPEWHITAWAIRAETQTYPHLPATGNDDRVCLEPSREQKPTYLPVIEDYISKNRKKLRLERKFNLPEYALVGPNGIYSGLPFSASVIFHVSAIGFNPDRTRALVYVGHDCGSLCGGGTYHFLVKQDGRWQVDREYRGISCAWAS
jgi:hypothetical protein